jgi:predicted RNA-binding Zn-ribbon protein involved in translation (DUF1610 family)
MSDSPQKPRGPLAHRIVIGFFTVLLAFLTYWSLDFVMGDISSLRGPQYADVEARLLNKTLADNETTLKQEAARIERERNDVTAAQGSLQASTTSLRETMNQLLEIQRLSLQRGAVLSEGDAKALAESKSLFLANQVRYQQLNGQLDELRRHALAVQAKNEDISSQLNGQRKEATRQYEELQRRHEWKKAAIKLLILIPLLFLAYYFFRTRRSSILSPIIYAASSAVLAKFFEVLHEYFPSKHFKYILMAIAIALVVQVLVYLLRMIASPKKDFLLKQYREAYERFVCPVCEYPIRRGPLRYAFWTKQSIRKLAIHESAAQVSDESYACPACGAMLYEKCTQCDGIRHSLLPYCEKCGVSKEVMSLT